VMLLTGCWLSEHWTRRLANVARLAVVIALFCTVVIRLPKAFWAADPQLTVDRWDDTYGWRELARALAPQVRNLPVITYKYQYSSELSFYLPNHPPILLVPDPNDPKEFQFLPGYQLPQNPNRLIVVNDIAKTGPYQISANLPAGYTPIESFPVEVDWRKHIIRRSLIVVAAKEIPTQTNLNPGEAPIP
jgi:hypothetical protein